MADTIDYDKLAAAIAANKPSANNSPKVEYEEKPCLFISFEYLTGQRDFTLDEANGDYWKPSKNGKSIELKYNGEVITLLTSQLLWHSTRPGTTKIPIISPINRSDSLSALKPREVTTNQVDTDIPLRVSRRKHVESD